MEDRDPEGLWEMEEGPRFLGVGSLFCLRSPGGCLNRPGCHQVQPAKPICYPQQDRLCFLEWERQVTVAETLEARQLLRGFSGERRISFLRQ